MKEMSGGIHEVFDLKNVDKNHFWNVLMAIKDRKCVGGSAFFVCFYFLNSNFVSYA
jgi:hypothetical protein